MPGFYWISKQSCKSFHSGPLDSYNPRIKRLAQKHLLWHPPRPKSGDKTCMKQLPKAGFGSPKFPPVLTADCPKTVAASMQCVLRWMWSTYVSFVLLSSYLGVGIWDRFSPCRAQAGLKLAARSPGSASWVLWWLTCSKFLLWGFHGFPSSLH